MKMHAFIRAGSAIVGLCLGLATQPSFAETMTRPAAGVTQVDFNVPGELQVRQGVEEKLVVEAEPVVLSHLAISLRNGVLTLGSKDSFKSAKAIKFTLTLKSFRNLKHQSSGNALIEGFAGGDIDIAADGSGDVTLKNIKPGALRLAIKGSGSIAATGEGRSLAARIDGTGSIDTTKFKAQFVEASIDGSGDIRVYADRTLKATIEGSGNIEYTGRAKVTQSVNGAGSVDRL